MTKLQLRAMKKTLDNQFSEAYYQAMSEGIGAMSFADLAGNKITVSNKVRTVVKKAFDK